MADNEIMTVEEVAAYLRLHKQTVMRLAARGELPGVKVANQWRFKRANIEATLDAAPNPTQDDNLRDKLSAL
jgi:excisionase family DNA binding protein